MAFKTAARSVRHRLQSLWKSLRKQVPLLSRNTPRRGSSEYIPVSMHAVSTLVDTDYLRNDSNKPHSLVVVNPDPFSDFEYESSEPDEEPVPEPISPSTVRLAHLLMDTDYLTPQQEDTLCLLLRAGYAAQDARPTRYSSSDELFFDI
ncbi:hypothetical protein BDV59DRAFT_200607 [Aspergillus ambiguus]|uniref:uncharacterized protein n=1 Tax=Aspergillus ambiguus TaxID=176160 RepID=UPI003CCD1598